MPEPEPTQENEPVPVITPPTSAPNQSKSKYIEKKTKRGFNRVKGKLGVVLCTVLQ